jgi:2,3,4,5-tetrahydropyridine-2-carboxylate N-succinyltransferase
VLEPVGALPVIAEDGAFIGGGCGLYEGVRVGRRAVLAPGVVVTRSVPVHDLVNEIIRAPEEGEPLIPADAVVVPGSRPASGDYARSRGIQLQTPVIVKYRDPGTDAAVVLEEALR